MSDLIRKATKHKDRGSLAATVDDMSIVTLVVFHRRVIWSFIGQRAVSFGRSA